MKRHIITLILLVATVIASSASALTQRADSAYSNENYSEAIDLYRQAIEADGTSSTLWYNLGNAYYRHGNMGQAVISYERALKLDPSNADARFNLQFVNSLIVDKPEDNSSFLTRIYNDVMAWLSPNAWAWTAFAMFLLVLGCVALYIFSSAITVRKAGFFGGIVLIFATVLTVFLAADSVHNATSHDTAVVTAPTTHLSSTPRSTKSKTEKVVAIHEGTKVEIIDSIATPDDPVSPKWYEVKINNGTTAWLRAADVERI